MFVASDVGNEIVQVVFENKDPLIPEGVDAPFADNSDGAEGSGKSAAITFGASTVTAIITVITFLAIY